MYPVFDLWPPFIDQGGVLLDLFVQRAGLA
jgi:hypothetical protein